MLHGRFPAQTEEIDRFLARVLRCRSPGYKMSAMWFFRLKVLGWLPVSLRVLLQQKVLGREFYANTQETAEEVLRSAGISPTEELGSRRHMLSVCSW